MSEPRVLDLVEFQTKTLDRDELDVATGERIWREFGKQVQIEFPSPKTDNRWQLTNQGFAGYLPVSPDVGVLLTPKVSLTNLFRMLAYAYNLKHLRFFDDLVELATLQDAYEQLALLLVERISDRARRGLYRTYRQEHRRLPYVRGRIDMAETLQRPWQVGLPCHYRIHTADVEDNQILFWTLETIIRSGVCRERALRTVRKTHRELQGTVSLIPFTGGQVAGRYYSRLNADYATLHALCRFFLEHSGPTHQLGDRKMIPFVVDMARLFERFVAAWLKENLPYDLILTPQERVTLGDEEDVEFRIDLVIRDRSSRQAICVADTKYKNSSHIAPDDVAQVVAYASVEDAGQAFLIYPEDVKTKLDVPLQHVRVRALGYPLVGNLQFQGERFLGALTDGIVPTLQRPENVDSR